MHRHTCIAIPFFFLDHFRPLECSRINATQYSPERKRIFTNCVPITIGQVNVQALYAPKSLPRNIFAAINLKWQVDCGAKVLSKKSGRLDIWVQ
jgi:hypothetical protein